jgi:tetratricopeptide (TPR) repeat protein
MLNLVIALAVGLALTFGVRLAGFPWIAGIIPGAIGVLATFILLGRRIATRVQAIVGEAQKELSAPAANARDQKQRVDKAVKLLETALPYSRWQFLVAGEIWAQIAMIKYMVKDLEGAEVAFAKANPRNHMSLALQAAMHFQKKQFDQMKAKFEAATKNGRKEGVVWAAYAWCLLQLKQKDEALKVMGRAVQANPSDDKLKAGLTALQNDKKLKMKAYEPLWWQFGLEAPPQLMPPGGRPVRWARR